MRNRTTPPPQVPLQVVRTLYHSLLKEVRALDNRPILKVLFPLPKTLQDSANLSSPLYAPNGPSYEAIVKKAFRQDPSLPISIGFEALNRIKMHNSAVAPQLADVTKDHAPILGALTTAAPRTSAYRAAPLFNEAPAAPVRSKPVKVDKHSKAVLKMEPSVDLKVGMCLIAHPLSSAHVDRRVMLITEMNPHVTTAVVLDMVYTTPLSHGNPMFPEVFWGHGVSNGGYCHVDYTMPPTANVAILHTLEPPVVAEGGKDSTWSSWVKGKPAEKPITSDPARHHQLLCTPIIPGATLPNGTVEPTLYYSKAEALPYLATLCPGKPSSSLRVFWGAMKWPTTQIKAEVVHGHWIPVTISSSFSAAYPFFAPPTAGEQRFATEEELVANRDGRIKRSGADVVVPQTFPPNHPMCYRESLWDQVLFALGGEFKELVGIANPFSNPKNAFTRVPSVDMLAPSDEGLILTADDDDE